MRALYPVSSPRIQLDNCTQEFDLVAAIVDILLILIERFYRKMLSEHLFCVGLGEDRDWRPGVNMRMERFSVEFAFQHKQLVFWRLSIYM